MSTATKNKPKTYAGKTVPPTINTPAWRQAQYEEACENYAYYKRVAAATENPAAKDFALGRARLWKSTRDARLAQL